MTNEIKELGKLIELLVDMLDTEPTPASSEGKPELSEQVKKTLDAGMCPREQVWKDVRGAKRVLLCPKCSCAVKRIDQYCSHCGQKLAQTAP